MSNQQILVVDLHRHYPSETEMIADVEAAVIHAYENEIPQMEVIVGRGEGRLRSLITQELDRGYSSQFVKKFTLPEQNPGMIEVIVKTLKKS